MASFNIMNKFEIHKNELFLDKAKKMEPHLIQKNINCESITGKTKSLKQGDKVIFDFGNHYVGYPKIQLSCLGSHQDAPAFIKLKFAEMKSELSDDSQKYDGWISKGWIQEEWIHIDVLPTELKPDRRYAFRYLMIEVLATSQKFTLNIDKVEINSVSAVSMEDVKIRKYEDELLNKISEVGTYTLKECMQLVFEDGPKRDRRLWLGDLRLQALSNYVTFKNYDLVKRCLYLFAGLTFNDEQISACLFTEPDYEPDDTYLMDYALFFVCTLYEYYEATNDIDTVKELYSVALRQIENVKKNLNERNIIIDQKDAFWCFVDWSEGLNKQACAQAIFIYAIKYGIKLAEIVGDFAKKNELDELQVLLKDAAKNELYDQNKGLFVSGEGKQISIASQVWMILAEVLDENGSKKLLRELDNLECQFKMVTPYMYHYYIEALLKLNENERAVDEIKKYWGGMIAEGADTFWELYNPDNPKESPYGSNMVNSYCHAWSCTPVYLLDKI